MTFHLITEYSAALLGTHFSPASGFGSLRSPGEESSMTPLCFPQENFKHRTSPWKKIPHPKQKTFSFNTLQPFSISMSPHTKFQIIGLSKRSQRFGQGTRQSRLVEPTGKGIPWNLQSFCLMLIHFGLVIGKFANFLYIPRCLHMSQASENPRTKGSSIPVQKIRLHNAC